MPARTERVERPPVPKAPQEEPPIASLQVLEGSNAGQIVVLDRDQTLLGRSPECHLQANLGSVSWRHAQIVRVDEQYLLEDLGSTNHTFLNRVQLDRPEPLSPGDLIRLGPDVPIRYSRQSRSELELSQRLFLNATRDLLTGLLNRVSFFQQLEQEVALSARHRSPFCLLLADVDHFKRLNDTYGHPGGDEALRSLGRLFQNQSRLEDAVGRIGGEEFAFVLRRTETVGGREFAERLRTAVESTGIRLAGEDSRVENVRITISLGLVGWVQGDSPAGMFERADRALYQAKHRGRNQLVVD